MKRNKEWWGVFIVTTLILAAVLYTGAHVALWIGRVLGR